MSWKVMMTIFAKRDYRIRQMNVIIAFLYEFFDEKMYVRQSTRMKDETNRICLLKKTFYDLKQFSRVWYQILQNFLQKLSFKRVETNHDFFVSINKFIFVVVYVDNLLFFENFNDQRVKDAMQSLRDRFQMIDLNDVSHYLDMKIDNDIESKTITLRQSTYLRKIVARYDMKNCKLIKILMSSRVFNSLNFSFEQIDKETLTWYQSIVETLMWSAMHFRSNLAQAVKVLNRFCNNSRLVHVVLVKQMLRYVSNIINKRLVFDDFSNILDDLVRYIDFDFVDSKTNRKPIEDYVFKLANVAINHCFKLQIIVALSICEVEYVVMCEIDKKIVWIEHLLIELKYRKKKISILFKVDNQRVIALAKNLEFHRRTKHIDVRFHWIRDAIERRRIDLEYVFTKNMIVDDFIKSLSLQRFLAFLFMINMRDIIVVVARWSRCRYSVAIDVWVRVLIYRHICAMKLHLTIESKIWRVNIEFQLYKIASVFSSITEYYFSSHTCN